MWGVKGPTATWEGDYAEIYGPSCDYENPSARCFSAWGYDGSWQQGFESGPGDELTVDSWNGTEATGSLELGNAVSTFVASNCGEVDFADEGDDGDETDPNPGGVQKRDEGQRAAKPARRGSWKLRFR